MSRKRMFRKGKVIRSMNGVADQLKRHNYIFVYEKPQHPGWVRSMQFATVLSFLNSGALREAVRNDL